VTLAKLPADKDHAGAPTWILAADHERVARYMEGLPSDEHRLRLFEWIRAQNDWRRTPGTLALRLDPSTIQTPALALIDDSLVDLLDGPVPIRGGVRGLIVCMAPQEGKSERVSRRGAEWMLERNPDWRVALVSYGLSTIRRVTALIRSDIKTFDGTEGNADLGLRIPHGEDAATRFNLTGRRGGIYGIGIGGELSGRPVDAMIIDDPVKDYRAADSELQSDRTWVWWQSVARPRLPPGAPVVLVLTRWSDLDLAGRLLAQQRENEEAGLIEYDEWTVVSIPAQADHDPQKGEADPLGRDPGEWMISARGRTPRNWQATKNNTKSTRVWAALYQQHPQPLEGGELKRKWWKYTNTVPRGGELLASWDMKLKERESGDYVVGGMWRRVGSKFYLHEVLRGQWDFPTVRCAVALMAVRYPDCGRHIVENAGNGPEVMRAIKEADPDYSISEDIAGTLGMTDPERNLTQLLLRRGMTGVIGETPRGSKAARMRAQSGHIEAGDVFLPGTNEDDAPRWVKTFVDECAAFGVGGSYDDQVDMCSQALKYLSRRHDPDEPPLQVAEGRVPPTTPTAAQQVRGPQPGRIPPSITRQGQIVRRQLDRGEGPTR
jgi:phage terminase large subunit-like protein